MSGDGFKRTTDVEIGGRLRALRKRHKMSQEQLGEQIQASQNAISNWELGETSMPNMAALALLWAMGVRHQWLLAEEGDPYIKSPGVNIILPYSKPKKKKK